MVYLVRRRQWHTWHLVELLYLVRVWKERHVDLGSRLVGMFISQTSNIVAGLPCLTERL